MTTMAIRGGLKLTVDLFDWFGWSEEEEWLWMRNDRARGGVAGEEDGEGAIEIVMLGLGVTTTTTTMFCSYEWMGWSFTSWGGGRWFEL